MQRVMKSWVLLLILAMTAAFATAFDTLSDSTESREQRLADDASAKEAFHQLNFFAEGRGMHLSPNMWNVWLNDASQKNIGIFENRWGLNVNGKTVEGIFSVPYKDMEVAVLGCVACHSGKAAGQYIIGLGNKNIDVAQLGADGLHAEEIWKLLPHPGQKSEDFKEVQASSIEFAKILSNKDYTNLTQGMVPTSVIRTWFYRQAGVPIPKDLPRAAVKVPFLWGYTQKKEVGSFSDGFGDGRFPGWAVAVEITAGQSPETVHSYLPKIQAAEDLFGKFLPPKYPFAIDAAKAQRGKDVFRNNCAQCHGEYQRDADDLPIFQGPNFIPWTIVQTDQDRITKLDAQLYQLVATSPLNDILKTRHQQTDPVGYFAPRLDGIWARFPYFHNASVPNVRMILTAPEDRPKVFSLKDAGEEYRFSQKDLGLTLSEPGSDEEKDLEKQARKGARDVYFVERQGHSNLGHDFNLSKRLSSDEKDAVIEYLKTL